jgi:shikimate dehydrogenase
VVGDNGKLTMASSDQARLFGVLGDPVDHSLSPAMQNAAFAASGLPHLYLRYRVSPPALGAALAEAGTLGMGGLNLTVPLKEAAVPLVDRLTAAAERAGAVNTVVFRPDGGLVGDNTDGEGFLRAVRGRVPLRGARAVLIGAGGSARAVATALAGTGCAALTIANRTPARAERLAAVVRGVGPIETAVVPLSALATGDVLAAVRLVVNATPLGLAGARLRVRYAATPRECTFVDLVYARRPTPFLAGAARAGRATIDGGPMLLDQGALAFEAWTGRPAPRAAMVRALRAAGLELTRPGGAASIPARRPPKR